MMGKKYRERNPNWVIVRDLLLDGQRSHMCIEAMEECRRIGIDPEGYELEVEQDADD
jgi:hypothetical protein